MAPLLLFFLRFLIKALVILIKLYQILISSLTISCCRFRPTCSQYGIEALHSFGILKGSWLIIKRILKCHPLHPGGIDLVPGKILDTRRNK